MNKCKYCDKQIGEEDQIFQCPDCINNFHVKCVSERIINTETIMGRKRKYKIFYYKCPICSKKVRNSQIN